jgi:BA14K-like protein
MKFLVNALMVTAAATVLTVATPVAAAPLSPAAGGTALTSQLNEAGHSIQVRRHGGNIAAGIIGGAIIGGIIASQPRYYYGTPYYYGAPYPVYRRPYYTPYDPAVAYCARRFRSYDPYSMTYLGYDGFRHPCP